MDYNFARPAGTAGAAAAKRAPTFETSPATGGVPVTTVARMGAQMASIFAPFGVKFEQHAATLCCNMDDDGLGGLGVSGSGGSEFDREHELGVDRDADSDDNA